jgi:hypothetical protein
LQTAFGKGIYKDFIKNSQEGRQMQSIRKIIFTIIVSLFLQALYIVSIHADSITPTVGFTARVIGGQNVVVGSGDIGFLSVKEGTSDRVALEFNIQGRSITSKNMYLNFYMNNFDDPKYSMINLYSYAANGLVNANDYYRKDNYILNFSDYGVAGLNPFSLNLTSTYNGFIQNGTDYLGVLLAANDTVARYFLTQGDKNSAEARAISLSNNKIPTTGIFDMTVTSGSDYSVSTHFGEKAVINYWYETDNSNDFGFDVFIGGIKYTINTGNSPGGWITQEFDIPSWLQNNDGSIRFHSDSVNDDAIVYLKALPASVPEPTTMLLLGLGLMGLAGIRRKFKK